MGNHRNSNFIEHTVSISAALTVVIIAILLAFAAMAPNSHRRGPPVEVNNAIGSYTPQAFSPIASDLNPATAFAGRPLFPFSVVPGGVASPQELLNAMGNDPIVARHYAGFDARAARIVTLHQEERAYVSYRVGEEIFWTKAPVRLHEAETVISDGNFEARTRCGNRVSATPQLPVSAREPQAEAFDQGQISEVGNLPMNSRLSAPLAMRLPVENYVATTEGENVFLGNNPPFILEPVIPEPKGPMIPPYRPPVPPVPPAPPIATPEPGAGAFLRGILIAGLLAGWLLDKAHGHAVRIF